MHWERNIGEKGTYFISIELLKLVEKVSKVIPNIRRLHTNGLNLGKVVKYNGKAKNFMNI